MAKRVKKIYSTQRGHIDVLFDKEYICDIFWQNFLPNVIHKVEQVVSGDFGPGATL